jgi:hypothetical protein
VRDALVAYEDPATGERLVESVLLGEQLYSGPHSDLGPDLLVLPRPLWAFTYTDAASGPTTWPTGAHRQQGILVASGGRTARGHLDDHDIADVAATAMAFCGISPKDLDGRPIPAIAGVAAEATTTLQDGVQTTRSPADLSNDEQEQIAEHLRNLGYLE